MSSADDADPLPGVPDVGADEFDAMVDGESADPRDELAKTDHDTDLGIEMAADAKRVARGELTGDEYWEKHDAAAREEFGDA
ncbi:MAG: 4Fe-4S ferredoxin N-terminal domain-containing protein, partial [Salinigranum sp.]